MRAMLLLCSVLALVGCQTKQLSELSYSEQKALAGQIVQRCVEQGVKPGTQEMVACTKVEIAREDYKRKTAPRLEFHPEGAAAALQGVSQGYYRAAATTQANMSSNVTCTSRPAPAGYSSVSCY